MVIRKAALILALVALVLAPGAGFACDKTAAAATTAMTKAGCDKNCDKPCCDEAAKAAMLAENAGAGCEKSAEALVAMATDSGCEEPAVNIPNNGALTDLPNWIAVEVPATVDKDGVHAIPMGRLPSGFLGLLTNQIGVHDMTAEAILKKSRTAALQALLVDPIVNNYQGIEEMLDTMIEYQEKWLGYLK